MTLLLALLLTMATDAQAPAAAARKAVVRGHVYARATGQPVRRAAVTLMRERGGYVREGLTAITDARGAFEIRDVDPGTYELRCIKGGYLEMPYGWRPGRLTGAPLAVRAGEELANLDFHLVRGAGVSGVVLDEDGEPLNYVTVRLARKNAPGGRLSLSEPRGQADERGRYRLPHVPPGRYFVLASILGLPQELAGYMPLYYPGVLARREAREIEVREGEEVEGINFRMRPSVAAEIRGRVVDHEGKPARGGLNCFRADDPLAGGASAVLRPDGSFHLRGVPLGRNVLVVEGPLRAERVVDVQGNMEGYLVRLGPGVAVQGRVIVENSSAPVEGLRLFLRKTEGLFGGAEPAATVGSDGAFAFSNVDPGRYSVSFVPRRPFVESPPPWNHVFFIRSVRRGEEDVLSRGMEVGDESVQGLEVTLDGGGGAITGQAFNAGGAPATDVEVVLIPTGPGHRDDERYLRFVTPDHTGRYLLQGLIPGEYLLIAWPGEPAALLDAEALNAARKLAVIVQVEARGKLERELRVTPAIRKLAAAYQ